MEAVENFPSYTERYKLSVLEKEVPTAKCCISYREVTRHSHKLKTLLSSAVKNPI